jgi:hypothetical protein
MTDARPAPRFSAAPAHSRRINESDGRRRTAVTFGRRERTGKAVTAVLSAPMVCVTILAGPRASEWFVTRLGGLRDGLGFAYLDE